jgi:hypothetical protein
MCGEINKFIIENVRVVWDSFGSCGQAAFALPNRHPTRMLAAQ